jgi:NADH-quinone oxidoreductase subunit G
MPTIHVDGQSYRVPAEADLLSALIDLGINVPYFCWHPALGSVGACRQCAVRVYHDESDRRGRIVMACMTPVSDGLRVSVSDPEVSEFRRQVIEWLMINHPHDCPICDEGGECHLQDMTVMVGHVYRRYRGPKRTYRDQNLGPFLNHEMNRCIQCYRCLRFYRDYAGGRDFDAFASKNQVYFGRYEDGLLESEFSGNLVEVCPTGVFTDKTLKAHYTRKWDLETAPSVCVHCGLGCNTIIGARYELLRRVQPRCHPEINRYFICDRGRFGYEFVNDPRRLRQPLAGRSEGRPVSWPEAMRQAQEALAKCRRVLGVGSPRASLEANYALQVLVGEQAFSPGMSSPEQAATNRAIAVLKAGPARSAALADAESADAVLILGTDPTNEAPMLDLAIRQGVQRARLDISRGQGIPDWNDYAVRNALQQAKGELHIASVAAMKLDAIATGSFRMSPPEIAGLGLAVASAVAQGRGDEETAAGRIAAALVAAKHPLVVVSASGGDGLLRAAAEVARALSQRTEAPCLLSVVIPECNSMGAALLGGRSVDDLLGEIEAGAADGLIVLENDLFRRASPSRVEKALRSLQCLVVLDCLPSKTSALADLVLPAAAFAETTGTLVNSEGRAQRFYQAFIPAEEPRASWQILRDLIEIQRPGQGRWAGVEDVLSALAQARPDLAGARDAAPPASWRDRVGQRVARESHRASGRTAKDAARTVFEPQPPADRDSPFAFSMEGHQTEAPPALTPRYWYPAWNSMQALFRSRFESGGTPPPHIPGRRLLEQGGEVSQPLPDPAPPKPLGPDEIWLAPQAAIFGSEELSRQAPGIASVIAPAAVRLHPEEAARRSLSDGDLARLMVGDQEYRLSVELDAGVAPGLAVVPAGYAETEGILSVTPATIERLP